jgi:hypothetical protein
MSDLIRPFKIQVSEADLEDLKKRLRATRWPDPQTVSDWSQGVPLDYVQKICEYWARDYDWRKIEARLNALPQFRTDLDGLGIAVSCTSRGTICESRTYSHLCKN